MITERFYRYYLDRVGDSDREKHIWAVVGDQGAMHFWCEYIALVNRHVGGIEVHYRESHEHAEGPPDNEDCWLLKGPCWHDGSSLWAEEYWIPMWKRGASHGEILNRLAAEYLKRFESEARND